jgi:hypothetical protein
MAVGTFGSGRPSADVGSVPAGRQDLGALAPAFVHNAGETDAAARFVSVGGGRPVFLTADDVRIVDVRQGHSLWLTFVEGHALSVDGESPTGGRVTSFLGHATSDSLSSRIAYQDVVYRRLWPGIDARVSGVQRGLKYSFEIAPYSDPLAIHLRYDGVDRMTLNDSGELIIEAGGQTILDRAPTAYQRIDGRTVPIDVRFVQHGTDVRFSVGHYDRTLPLVIDPTLVYSTFLGSSGSDAAHAIAVDPSGAAYVVGTTGASDFPTTAGSYQPTFRGGTDNKPSDAFVAKINVAGTAFEYVTYLGGSNNDGAFGVAVDANGYAYVTGYTESDDFPTTVGAFQNTIGPSHHDGFLVRLDDGGDALLFSTFFGANGPTDPAGVAVDSSGNAYVAGGTFADNMPVTPAAKPFSPNGQSDGFLMKFDNAGHVTFGTSVGSAAADAATSVAVDGGGHAFVTGWTRSSSGDLDAFVWKLDTNANALPIVFAQNFGGSMDDAGVAVAVGPAGNAVVAVETESTDFPTTAPGPVTNSVLVRLSSDGTAFTSSTFVGASNPPPAVPTGVAVDRNYIAYVVGSYGAKNDVQGIWINRVDLSGVATATLTLQGQHSNVGPSEDIPAGIALGPTTGDVFIAGSTNSYDFPITAGAPQPTYGSGASDAFVARISFGAIAQPLPNLARNRPVWASSEFGTQYAAPFAVDGDPSTRWSSEFSDQQWIYVDLGQNIAVSEVILRWETAYGAAYEVQMSNDAKTWVPIRSVSGGQGGVDDLTGLSGSGRYLRIYGMQRGTIWGYSLWELEVYGAPDSPPLVDLARHQQATASSRALDSPLYDPSNAVDGDPTTRWSSNFNDDEWIYVDLKDFYTVNEVILHWETAFGAQYEVQVSDDAMTWETIGTVTNGTGGVDDLTGLSGTGRYVRMHGIQRGTVWGYSLWSFEVYGNPAP